MIESLLGGVFGGLLRLAPELLKLFDKKNERTHELAMLDREIEFAKTRAEAQLRQGEVQLQAVELDTMAEAFREQALSARAAGKFVAALSALVRPLTTYYFLAFYGMVKAATFIIAYQQGAGWSEVIVSMWSKDDAATLSLIISFWFVGRVYERSR